MSDSSSKPRGTRDGSSSSRERDVILEFQHEAKEIEGLLKTCITEHHLSTRSSQILTLVKEWKALHKRITGKEIDDDQFYQTTEIGKFVGSHSVFEDLERSI
jgi:hypothetical protein